jgi:transcriptional regulator with XRE-family HTH domain
MEVGELRHRFGIRLRTLRRSKGLTQEQLAAATDVSSDAVGNIERGANSPSIDTAYMIATALGAPLAALYEIDDPIEPQPASPARAALMASVDGLDEETLGRVVDVVAAALKLRPWT